MIAEAYFEQRAQLGRDLFQLAQLVRELGGSGDDVQILDHLITSLHDPFVFVVVGEVNVGKSTFLNALFGQDFARTGVIPTTDKIYFFKHGPQVRSVPITPTLEEVHVPCDFLKDFHIVDTPGTNSIENEHQQITERFVPSADLVVFVFSAMNPWGASAWQFLDKVHRQWLRNVVFVLQQSDLRSPEELGVITDYMRQLCVQRYGREFPVFEVSAKKAFLARSTGIDREALLKQSGFLPMEEHINALVTQQPMRQGKLHSAVRLARQILEQRIESVTRDLKDTHARRQLLTEMEAERNVQVERTQAKLLLTLDATDHDYREASARLTSLIARKLTLRHAFAAVREETRLPNNLDHRLNQDLLTHAGARWQQMANVLADDFTRFENYIAHHWRGELNLLPSETDPIAPEPPSQEARGRFLAKAESTLRRFVLSLEMEPTLLPGITSSRDQAQRYPWIVGSALVISIVLYFAFGLRAAAIGGALTLSLSSVLLLLIHHTCGQTLRQFVQQLEQGRSALRQMLHDQAHEETERAFQAFDRVLLPAKEVLSAQDQRGRHTAERLFALQTSLQQLAATLPGK